MNPRFSYKEMRGILDDVGEPAVGETIHIHHCKEGDHNDRLYITNKGDIILFYCHHCLCKGAYRPKLSKLKSHLRKDDSIVDSSKKATPYIPSDAIHDIRAWPVQASVWPSKAHLSYEVVGYMRMAYSPSRNRVYVPVYFEGEYQGYISRRIDDKDGSPKYIQKFLDKEKFIYSCVADEHYKTVILVEDVLSATRLKMCGYNAVAILGTHVTDGLLHYLTQHYDSFIIWMDNDKREVKLKQVAAKRKLESYGKVKIIKTDLDPKEYSDTDIEEILNDKIY